MNAQELTKALGGRFNGSGGLARCPAHADHDPSLSLRDGAGGTLLTHCFAGCVPEEVWAALVNRGLVDRAEDRPAPRRRAPRSKPSPEPSQNQDHALEIWRASQPASDTPVERYLRSRSITIPAPTSIQFHPNLKHGPTGLSFEAMVAAVQGLDRGITGVHRTFLLPGGRGKAQVRAPKMMLGPIGHGAVRLGPAATVLGVCEGIETGFSAMQFFEVPIWAALGSRMDRIELPECVVEVHVFGDNGKPGHEAAETAASSFMGQGRHVFLRFPPGEFGDWNDALREEVAA